MSFTDQKQRIATEEECKARWGGAKNGERFRCYLCGHKFIPGDRWRWIYGKGITTNFIVCDSCDGPDDEVREKYKNAVERELPNSAMNALCIWKKMNRFAL